MRKSIYFVSALLMTISSHSFAEFTGDLKLTPEGCQSTNSCQIKEALRFKDKSNLDWEAPAGTKTDGASIPKVFQPYIGDPFDEKFIKAAIIHDHYCVRHVRSWLSTHTVFYEALVDQGVDVLKAKTMYLAVLLGGPKWITLIKGIPCGGTCINSNELVLEKSTLKREADFNKPFIEPALRELYAELQAKPEMSLVEIQERAKMIMPNDLYFENGDTLNLTPSALPDR